MLIFGLILLVVMACACMGPQLQIPRASPESVSLERQRQLGYLRDAQDRAFKKRIDQWRRVYNVYSRLRTHGAELCKSNVTPFWGLWLANKDLFASEERERAKRVLNLDKNVSVLAAGANASAIGIRARDVIAKIDGISLDGKLGAAQEIFQKAGMRPVEIEILRGGEKLSASLVPQLGCKCSLQITDWNVINAASDDKFIYIPYRMIEFVGDDDKLAHVIAHELSHNVLGHTERKDVNRSVGKVVGAIVDIGLLVGARVNTQGAFGKTGAQVGGLAYSQEFEREADYMSVYFMARAGFDPAKAEEFWRGLSVVDPGSIWDSYLSTHPSNPERAANIEVALAEVAAKSARQEALVPTSLGEPQTVAIADATQARPIIKRTLLERQPAAQLNTLKPVVPGRKFELQRRTAILTHVKGRLMSVPPVVLQAEFADTAEDRGTSRIIYPGNYIIKGEYRLVSLDQSFKGAVNASLLDPDKISPPPNASEKGFARFVGQDGTLMECSFSLSESDRIEQGRCVDNKGNEYRISD